MSAAGPPGDQPRRPARSATAGAGRRQRSPLRRRWRRGTPISRPRERGLRGGRHQGGTARLPGPPAPRRLGQEDVRACTLRCRGRRGTPSSRPRVREVPGGGRHGGSARSPGQVRAPSPPPPLARNCGTTGRGGNSTPECGRGRWQMRQVRDGDPGPLLDYVPSRTVPPTPCTAATTARVYRRTSRAHRRPHRDTGRHCGRSDAAVRTRLRAHCRSLRGLALGSPGTSTSRPSMRMPRTKRNGRWKADSGFCAPPDVRTDGSPSRVSFTMHSEKA